MGLDGTIPIEIVQYFGLNTKQSKAKLPLGFSADLQEIDLFPSHDRTAPEPRSQSA